MSEQYRAQEGLLHQLDTDHQKNTLSGAELQKAAKEGFFDHSEKVNTLLDELDKVDGPLKESFLQNLLKLGFKEPLYSKLKQHPKFMHFLQKQNQINYLKSLELDESKLKNLKCKKLPSAKVTITGANIAQYLDVATFPPDHLSKVVAMFAKQMELFHKLCPNGESLLTFDPEKKQQTKTLPSTIGSLSDQIKQELAVRQQLQNMKNKSLTQLPPPENTLAMKAFKLYLMDKLQNPHALEQELKNLNLASGLAIRLANNEKHPVFKTVLEQLVLVHLKQRGLLVAPKHQNFLPYIKLPIVDSQLLNFLKATQFGRRLLEDAPKSKDHNDKLLKDPLGTASPEQLKGFQDRIARFQERWTHRYTKLNQQIEKATQEWKDGLRDYKRKNPGKGIPDFPPELQNMLRQRDNLKYNEKEWLHTQLLTLTKDYVRLAKESGYKGTGVMDSPFLPGLQLDFSKATVDDIVRDSVRENFGTQLGKLIDDFKNGKREEVLRVTCGLVYGTVAGIATGVLTANPLIGSLAFTGGARIGGAYGAMLGAGIEMFQEGKMDTQRLQEAGLIGLGLGSRDKDGKYQWNGGDKVVGELLFEVGVGVLAGGAGKALGLGALSSKFGTGALTKATLGNGGIAKNLARIGTETGKNAFEGYVIAEVVGNVPRAKWEEDRVNHERAYGIGIKIKNDMTAQSGPSLRANIKTKLTPQPDNMLAQLDTSLAFQEVMTGASVAVKKLNGLLPSEYSSKFATLESDYVVQKNNVSQTLTDLSAQYPTLALAPDGKGLLLQNEALPINHPASLQLQAVVKPLNATQLQIAQLMEGIANYPKTLNNPNDLFAQKRAIVDQRKLMHPDYDPIALLDQRIQTQIARVNKKKPEINPQDEDILVQLQSAKQILTATV